MLLVYELYGYASIDNEKLLCIIKHVNDISLIIYFIHDFFHAGQNIYSILFIEDYFKVQFSVSRRDTGSNFSIHQSGANHTQNVLSRNGHIIKERNLMMVKCATDAIMKNNEAVKWFPPRRKAFAIQGVGNDFSKLWRQIGGKRTSCVLQFLSDSARPIQVLFLAL